jgi:hypothetical protein
MIPTATISMIPSSPLLWLGRMDEGSSPSKLKMGSLYLIPPETYP